VEVLISSCSETHSWGQSSSIVAATAFHC